MYLRGPLPLSVSSSTLASLPLPCRQDSSARSRPVPSGSVPSSRADGEEAAALAEADGCEDDIEALQRAMLLLASTSAAALAQLSKVFLRSTCLVLELLTSTLPLIALGFGLLVPMLPLIPFLLVVVHLSFEHLDSLVEQLDTLVMLLLLTEVVKDVLRVAFWHQTVRIVRHVLHVIASLGFELLDSRLVSLSQKIHRAAHITHRMLQPIYCGRRGC
mmetsp:Transcript_18628/g.44860  ORF Transcript_18628/g.44860 Transcript_18628/m.44860 type:complete len:217 (-) Transcript_18628:60-710(-)